MLLGLPVESPDRFLDAPREATPRVQTVRLRIMVRVAVGVRVRYFGVMVRVRDYA